MTNLSHKIGLQAQAVAAYWDIRYLENAVEELTTSGLRRSDLSILATERTLIERLHQDYVSVRELSGNSACFIPSGFRKTRGAQASDRLVLVATMTTGERIFASDNDIWAKTAAHFGARGIGDGIADVIARVAGRERSFLLVNQLIRGWIVILVHTSAEEPTFISPDRILEKHSERDLHAYVVRLIGK
jgi:hypothetical protein